MEPTMEPAELARRLDALDRKLDLVLERQRFVEDLIAEGMPVVREVVRASAQNLAELEARGWFAVGRELWDGLDRFVRTTSPEEVRELSTNLGGALRTLRHLTAPEVLQVADEATEVLAHADEVAPVGMVGAVRATSDRDVQRGLGIALELLRHLGRHPALEGARPAATPTARPAPERPAARPAPKPVSPAEACAPSSPPPAPAEIVEWEGRRFDGAGFLLDPATWDEELARKMADGLGLSLTDEHWVVLRWARQDWASTGASPNVRRVAAGSGVGTKRMYELFPRTPGKTTALLAGIPKPVGCV